MAEAKRGRALVIVESPTKAKTIKKFLPKEFIVEASVGHIRDLPDSAADIPAKYKKEAWAKLGVNVQEDFAPLYIIPKGKSRIISDLKKKMADVREIYLATDEDREGESISWHLMEVLKPKIPVKRMVFHEITKSAIEKALLETRPLNEKLVRAQETRRVLDRLFGYTLSPLLWKKIAFGLSAGRVQSVGLRVIVDRERARLKFKKSFYWDLSATLQFKGEEFESRLTAIGGNRIASGKDFDENTGDLKKGSPVTLLLEADAKQYLSKLKGQDFKVTQVEAKPFTQRPAPPFITSTLQQEANRKLGMSSRETMRVAQSLYEEGLITYMRTDSPSLSQEALRAARDCVNDLYGKEYLTDAPRQYSSKSKGAQEAHEAIRPSGVEFRSPKGTGLSGRELALYDLIWKRTVASQMREAEKLSTTVRMQCGDTEWSSSGVQIVFPGFLRAYVEGRDDPEAALEDQERVLPELKTNDVVKSSRMEADSHETKPPARYTEASLVQLLEKEGVGRPSTYASIISTILDRGYVKKVANALVPTFKGFAVIQLLEKHFKEFVDLGFTSKMESVLDEIADGEAQSVPYLKEFYLGKAGLLSQVETQDKKIDPAQARKVDLPHIDSIEVCIGKFGPYVRKPGATQKEESISASLPEDSTASDLTEENLEKLIEMSERGPEAIGNDPKTGLPIFALSGRFGPYVQVGETPEKADKKNKPRRASIPKGTDPSAITLEFALKLLSVPRELGLHPEKKKVIIASVGRFGPYVGCDGEFRSLKKEDDVYEVSLARALELFAEPKGARRGSKILKELGKNPKGDAVQLLEGRYGPYVKMGKVNKSLPKGENPDEYTLEAALKLVEG